MTPSIPSIITVSTLTELIKDTLEDNFANVWLRGEISNLSIPASGHWYFTLKDSRSQLRCAMFRTSNRRISFRPENGQQVICQGRVSLYGQRGDVQFIGDSMEVEGLGGLQLAYEQLKKDLETEGLFHEGNKQTLPPFPRTVGVVTSATGAAIHDIMNVLTRRAAGIRIILRPVLVQGDQAARDVATAITEFNQHQQADVLIVGRGGGSLEDLQAFNTDQVARAIYASNIPVISAVGHETDFTIADFVADHRAPTPSAAAELVVKNRHDLEQQIDQLSIRLHSSLRQRLVRAQDKTQSLVDQLRSPAQLHQLKKQRTLALRQRLLTAFERHTTSGRQQLLRLTSQLDILSPLNTLERGFTTVSLTGQPKKMISRVKQLQRGDSITLRFSDGRIAATVTSQPQFEASEHEQP